MGENMGIPERVRKAKGADEVDLLLTGCRLVNVLSGRVHPASVAIADGMVVGLDGAYSAKRTLDLGGRYVAPGLIDAHVHIESSMVTVPQFASAVVPRGTTTVFTDCHEIANVMGVAGIRYIMESAALTPLEVYVMLPSCVPATPLETAGAVLEAADLEPLTDIPGVVGLGELMNFPGAINGAPEVMAKIELFRGRPIDGHAPGLSGMELAAYIAAGPDSDHECTTAVEAEEKMQKGMFIFAREGTGARNLEALLPMLNADNNRRCCLCTDDRHPSDLLERGHIDSMLRMVVKAGMSPVTALQMATINSARRFGLAGLGAVAVGYRADMVVFDDIESFHVHSVLKGGKVVAEDGSLLEPPAAALPSGSSFAVSGFSAECLRLAGDGGRVKVIGLVPGQIVTDSLVMDAPLEDGQVKADPGADLLKVAVVERHRGTGNVGVSFVKGFGLKGGALASSVAHDSHNIVVVGSDDVDMAAAVARIIEMGGGQVVVSRGKGLAELPLPIAGLMSPDPVSEVAEKVGSLNRAAADLGCSLDDPFMTMSFLALPVIPELKLTDRGLVDVSAFDFVSPFA